jgi:hypothetical protein
MNVEYLKSFCRGISGNEEKKRSREGINKSQDIFQAFFSLDAVEVFRGGCRKRIPDGRRCCGLSFSVA